MKYKENSSKYEKASTLEPKRSYFLIGDSKKSDIFPSPRGRSISESMKHPEELGSGRNIPEFEKKMRTLQLEDED